MNQEIYIIIGICVFAFIIGSKIRQKMNSSKQNHVVKKSKSKHKVEQQSSKNIRKEKVKGIFVYIQLVIVFGLLIFMIPALSRDLLSNQGTYGENLILRILIVAFSVYILFMGFMKISKSNKKK